MKLAVRAEFRDDIFKVSWLNCWPGRRFLLEVYSFFDNYIFSYFICTYHTIDVLYCQKLSKIKILNKLSLDLAKFNHEDGCCWSSCLCFCIFHIKRPKFAANKTKIVIQRVSFIQKFLLIISRVFLSANLALPLISWFSSRFLLMTYRWAPSSVATLFVVSLVYSATRAMFLILSLWSWIFELISTNSLCLGSRLNPSLSSIMKVSLEINLYQFL